jgi:hypothetical protein
MDIQNMDNNQYMMEDMTMLPDITILHLYVNANGHRFGASAFHVLRMCSGIRRLMLTLPEAEVRQSFVYSIRFCISSFTIALSVSAPRHPFLYFAHKIMVHISPNC